nr:immunoglobulin heavy chain junction region [Mus musculus]MBK4198653.1 immunoglobulin heavy chain junction region [Mus musculus]MBK4198654.1 immunoglobulin heavy chain junction region [Mus musculus]
CTTVANDGYYGHYFDYW